MKILIIGFAKIKYMPYLHFYLDHLPRNQDIYVAYWNRDGQPEELSAYGGITFYEFSEYQEDNVPPVSKIRNFAKFRKFVKDLLRENEFDLLICLHTFPCVLIADELQKRYQNRYIFDYRDSTYEAFAPFKKLIGRLVQGSFATFVSSDGFRQLLPADCREKIITSHNILLDSLNYRDCKIKSSTPEKRIRIGFWGYIRNEEVNREIIRKVAEDPRFELHYYGREQQVAKDLKQYARKIQAENVFFHGEYIPEDRYEFAKHTDLLHNIYDDANMMLAMSNKYYDGLLFYIPQLCMSDSAMGNAVRSNGVGLVCDPYCDDYTEQMWRYYHSIDRNVFFENCDRALTCVLAEYQLGRTTIEHAVKN